MGSVEAACFFSPVSDWRLVNGVARITTTVRDDSLYAVQGVQHVPTDGGSVYAVTTGHSNSNASILNENGKVLNSRNLGGDAKSSLLADVADTGDSLWWTDYRYHRLFRTNHKLENAEIITLPEEIGTLVGITYVPELDAVVFPTRNASPTIAVMDAQPPFDVKYSPVKDKEVDYYDVRYGEGCLFVVQRAQGRIFWVDPQQLTETDAVDMHLLIDNLARPQHIEFVDHKLYVIETAAYQVSKYDLETRVRTIYPLPEMYIKRGLSVAPNGDVWLTGFFDPDDELSEGRTGLVRLSLSE